MGVLDWLYKPRRKITDQDKETPAAKEVKPGGDSELLMLLKACAALGDGLDAIVLRPELSLMLLRMYSESMDELFNELSRPTGKNTVVAVSVFAYFRRCSLTPSLAIGRLVTLLGAGCKVSGQASHDIINLCSDLQRMNSSFAQDAQQTQ